jgi:hypothetical protein
MNYIIHIYVGGVTKMRIRLEKKAPVKHIIRIPGSDNRECLTLVEVEEGFLCAV